MDEGYTGFLPVNLQIENPNFVQLWGKEDSEGDITFGSLPITENGKYKFLFNDQTAFANGYIPVKRYDNETNDYDYNINITQNILLDFSKFKLNSNGSLISLNYNAGSSSGIRFRINQYSSITLIIKMDNETDINSIVLYELFTIRNDFYYNENWTGPYYYYTNGGNFNNTNYYLYNDNNLILGVNGFSDMINNATNCHGTSVLFSNSLVRYKKM